MKNLNPNIEKNILDLRYQRHLQKIHTVFNMAVLVTVSIGVAGMIAWLSKQIALSFNNLLIIFLPIGVVWTIALSVRKVTNQQRKEIIDRLLEIGKQNDFNV